MKAALVVPIDLAEQIRELRAEGLSWPQIEKHTGIAQSTCERIVRGGHRRYSDELTVRQRARLLKALSAAAFSSQ